MRRITLLLVTALVAIVLLYLSRFWIFDLWGRPGLFGIQELRPGGGLLGRWLRGTMAAPFELLIWVTGGFLILTWLQRLFDALSPNKDDAHDD